MIYYLSCPNKNELEEMDKTEDDRRCKRPEL